MVARKDASLLMVSRTVGARVGVEDALSRVTSRRFGFSVPQAVRVCLLGFVIAGYGSRVPRHHRA